MQRPDGGLGHEVQGAHAICGMPEVGLRHADHGYVGAPATDAHGCSAGTKTGHGCPSPSRATRKTTRMPMCTASGAMFSTRLIMRKPSSRSMSDTFSGASTLR